MAQPAYGLKTRTTLDVVAAEARVRELLTNEGFGILTEIDVAETLRAKLGLTRGPYRILGACNPHLAAEALEKEADVGLLLPCNVVVYEDGTSTVVAVLDPSTMVSLTNNPALEHVASEALVRLQRVVDALSEHASES
ncbi:MAG TPA: DUF302 domain-containing protein [Acidimicrobiia bacterium]|nr:DUF302 domain-containing protein [Acidimicrobiia bacterium]